MIGFIGVGAMGGPMARRLLAAGLSVCAFDTDAERLAACAESGVQLASDAAEVVARGEIVLLSLPSSEVFVRVAEQTLLPNARPGQIFVDCGTTTPTETRRLAQRLAERDAFLVDAPVSGGANGAERGVLRTFVGGDPEAVARVRPILETIGGAEGLTACGPSGAGQIVKGVNQLAMGLGAAAYLEAVAFGVRAGVDPAIIDQAVGGDGEHWRAIVRQTAQAVADGRGARIGVKFRELPYYLHAARELGFDLPLTDALYAFCDRGERVVTDDNRPAPSFWHELCAQTNQDKSDDNDH